MFLTRLILSPWVPGGFRQPTYRCIVTPLARRSLTLRTLLITSRPRLSKTRTFHMGSPSSPRIEVDVDIRPFALASGFEEDSGCGEFKLRSFSIDAVNH